MSSTTEASVQSLACTSKATPASPSSLAAEANEMLTPPSTKASVDWLRLSAKRPPIKPSLAASDQRESVMALSSRLCAVICAPSVTRTRELVVPLTV